jgi:uncharacterized membrane protein YgcG
VTEQAVPKETGPTPDVQVFRPPAAVAIWWVWLLFALGNLIDLAVQGRDHLALTAAFVLVLITAVVYVTAQRPRVVAGPAGLTVVNPVAEHQIGWAAVAAAEPGELLRVRCEWPEAGETRKRVIQAWAVHSSRRRELTAELRAQRQARRGAGGGLSGLFGGPGGGAGLGAGGSSGGTGFGSFRGAGGSRPADPATEPDALRLDPARVIAVITERAEQARQAAPGDPAQSPAPATAPVSTWNWRAVALVLVPVLALLAVALA